MPAFRNTLRERAVSVLSDAGTAAGAYVFSNRQDPAKAEHLPMLTVSAGRERKSTQGLAIGTPEFRSTLSLEIRAYAAGASIAAAEDQIERLVDEVQNALIASDVFLASPVLQVEGVEIDVEFNGQHAEHAAFATIIIDVAYMDEYVTGA